MKTKQDIINKITLLDTSLYRIKGHHDTGVYTIEPIKFRSKLSDLYNELSIETLSELLKLKKNNYETNERISKAFNAFKKTSEQLLPENEYEPLNTLKIARTIYPKGKKQMSLNGKDEFYGLQER